MNGAHRECSVAADFLTVDVCTIGGLVAHYVLFFTDIANRESSLAGSLVNDVHLLLATDRLHRSGSLRDKNPI